ERSGSGAPPWHPRSYEDAAQALAPQAARVVDEIAELDVVLRGPHVVVEAKVLPNYLAGSHYPDDLLRSLELYTVGTRQSRGTYRTRKQLRENVPTKTYLIAGSDDSFRELARLIDDDPERYPRSIWDEIREFDTIALPSVDVVLRGTHPDAGDGELVTWEAVLNPLGLSGHDRRLFGDEVLEKFIRLVR